MASYEQVEKVVTFLKKRITKTPLAGIICGSGLGKLAERVEDAIIVPYTDIKEFPESTGLDSLQVGESSL